MNFIKKLFYGLMALPVLVSLGVVVCAFNPPMTAALAQKVGQVQWKIPLTGGGGGEAEGEGSAAATDSAGAAESGGSAAADAGSAAADSAEAENVGVLDQYINPDPVKPLGWQHRVKPYGEMTAQTEELSLEKAGITEDQVLKTLKDYYADCRKRLEAAGKGEKQFDNVIPQSLWSALDEAYNKGDHKKGYVDKALKKLGAQTFRIQLRVQSLGGGYCRVYHDVFTD